MKKKFILLGLVFLQMAGCSSVSLEQNDVQPHSKYYGAQMRSEILNRDDYNQFVAYARRIAVENNRLTKKQKKELAYFADHLSYQKNKYIYFSLGNTIPYLKDELKLKFSLKDLNSTGVIQSISMIPIKHTLISNTGTQVGYTYTWIIESKNTLDNFASPLSFKISFPDGSTKTYKINI
jgi:hypothetical protein